DYDSENVVAMIDPPRKGLYPSVCEALVQSQKLKTLFYLSCHPDSLIRDLKILISGGWKIETVIPFDFFPKTVHLETLVKLIR
ncbi:MAG: 23S rRNA (uracil-5-)-methyltransferase RumA, partial [Deltaproteobacteria bacterium]|nr:23S rRNA (uracil-5-)-methyltransferase RumA [Deltaproteobacteria bacterium]